MGAASGGRLTFSLVALAVLMASGAAGAAVIGSGRAPSPAESGTTARAVGTADQQPDSDGAAVSPAAPAAGASAARAASSPRQPSGSAAGRFNVGAPHSPELMHQLAGPLTKTGVPGKAVPQKATGRISAGPEGAAGTIAPLAAGTMPEGVDVASYQHPNGAAINWSQVAAAGYSFAAIKATEGNYYTNPYYASDLAAAKAAGLYVTGYHFAIPNVSGGAAQADYAVSHGSYAADGRTLPLELDVEYDPYTSTDHTNECYGLTAAQMVSWISAFDSEVQLLTGQAPIIYTTADWWNTCTGNSTAFGSDPLWVAAYAVSSPPMPAGWPNWTLWQFASSGTVPGITTTGATDISYADSNLVTLLDPGAQRNTPGSAVSLQVNSLNTAVGQALSFTASGLPGGLSISAAGQITGTISGSFGSYPVTVTATAASGATVSISFTWNVDPTYNPGGLMTAKG